MKRFVILSGCSGGGKTTIVQELDRRGFATVGEPGRRVIADERSRGGSALPWTDPPSFLQRVMEMSIIDLSTSAKTNGWVFFDRGLIDAAAGVERQTGEAAMGFLRQFPRFHDCVFFAPPWHEIYQRDEDRRHSFREAVVESEHLLQVYSKLGYELVCLPRATVSDRVDFILHRLSS